MDAELSALHDALPSLPWLQIVERKKGGAILLTPLEPLPEPRNLRKLKAAIRQRWGVVHSSLSRPVPGHRTRPPVLRTRRVPVQAVGQEHRPDRRYTLHQLRHSRLTHLGEDGWSSSMLMALSGHRNLRSLGIYVRPSTEAVAAVLAEHDPGRRRH